LVQALVTKEVGLTDCLKKEVPGRRLKFGREKDLAFNLALIEIDYSQFGV
jgi:hypothetical protein